MYYEFDLMFLQNFELSQLTDANSGRVQPDADVLAVIVCVVNSEPNVDRVARVIPFFHDRVQLNLKHTVSSFSISYINISYSISFEYY
jgi:hypothetical protein